MDFRALIPVALLVAIVAMFVLAVFGVRWLNRGIGKGYEDRAALLVPILQSEGIRFGEDGVQLREHWIAFFAMAIRLYDANVRVTTHAIYIFRYGRNMGERMAQPILAFALPGRSLSSAVHLYVSAGTLESIDYEQSTAILMGRLLGQRFTLRLPLQNAQAFAASAR